MMQNVRVQSFVMALERPKNILVKHHSKLSKKLQKLPGMGRRLEMTPPNIRQEGAMKALTIITLLGG